MCMDHATLTTTLSDLVVKYENISFVRFVDYVIGEATKHHCFDRSSACQVNEHYRQVFALKMCVFVWHMEMFDCFFRPYINQCHYCHVKYDVIGHLEDSFEDTMYIAMKQNLTALLPELTKNNRKTKGKKCQDRIGHYMSQLSTNIRKYLYKLYQLDFELFGYDAGNTICKNEACIEWLMSNNNLCSYVTGESDSVTI